MKVLLIAVVLMITIAMPVLAADGMINVPSAYDVKTSADRLEKILKEKGMTIFNRINHSKSAAQIGVSLRGTELIIFGNPRVGSPLMACEQSVAIDLPQKALIWQDDHKKVWISYNDPKYLQKRHGIAGCEDVIAKIEKALAGITTAAAGKKK